MHDPAMLPAVLEKWTASIAKGEPFEMVFPIRGADGVYRQFLTRVNAVRDGKGKILRWMGVNSNITGQRQAEVLLLERNAQLNAAFRQTYSFMLMLATDGTIVEVNDAALQAAGASRTELIGKKLWEVSCWNALPDEVEKREATVRKAAAGELVREECRYMLADETIRTLSPVKGRDSTVSRLVATGIDITEQTNCPNGGICGYYPTRPATWSECWSMPINIRQSKEASSNSRVFSDSIFPVPFAKHEI